MALELKKAQRTKAKLRLGISAPSGGGKTLGALLIAYGLMKEKYPDLPDEKLWEKIAVIDSENGSGELYVGADVDKANIKIGQYNAITLNAPFEADKYTGALTLCQDAGIEVGIIDSTSHLWAGEGGLLEQQQNATKRSGNSYTAWRDITPQHNHFVESMLQSNMHIIATMRSKTEYVQEKDSSGHTIVRKIGLNPVQRDGMIYEFTVFFEIDAEHQAFGSKDRTGIYDQKTFVITPKIGRELMKWLEGGTANAKEVIATAHTADPVTAVSELKKTIASMVKEASPELQEKYKTLFHEIGNPNTITDPIVMNDLISKMKELKETK
jgi:hypothetical protein